MVETIGSMVLLIMVLLAWMMPHARAALHFTEAEVAFLFPAPISRRALLHFKLLKSQSVIFLSAVFMTFIGRSWGSGSFLIRMFGWWVVFATLNLHLLGSSFAVTKLMDRGLSTWLRRILVLGMAGVVAGGIVLWLYYAVPPPPDVVAGTTDFSWLGRYASQVLHAGPLPYLLVPFRLVVAPYFATDVGQFLIALGPALAILGLHYWWVMRSNVAFEEASVEQSRKMAERLSGGPCRQLAGDAKTKESAPEPIPIAPKRPSLASHCSGKT